MFISVEYGEGKVLLCNPDCNAIVLQDYVRRACSISPKVTVDFSDDNANMMEIYNKDPHDNVFDYFMPRGTYILVQVDRNTDGTIKKIIPLLSEWEKKYPTMERKLRQRDKRAKQAAAAAEKENSKGSKNKGSQLSIKSDSPTGKVSSKLALKKEKSAGKGDNKKASSTPEDVPPKKSQTKEKKKKNLN